MRFKIYGWTYQIKYEEKCCSSGVGYLIIGLDGEKSEDPTEYARYCESYG